MECNKCVSPDFMITAAYIDPGNQHPAPEEEET